MKTNFNYVAVCEIEFTEQELVNLAKLSKLMSQDIADVARMCMNERCHELIGVLEQQPQVDDSNND